MGILIKIKIKLILMTKHKNKIQKNVLINENKFKYCFNCKLTKNICICDFCMNSFCSLCSFVYKKIDNKNKKQIIFSCFGCKLKKLKQENKFEKYIKNKNTFNYDILNNIIKQPIWENINLSILECIKCNKILNKKYICNVCGEVMCKNCKINYIGNEVFEIPKLQSNKIKF